MSAFRVRPALTSPLVGCLAALLGLAGSVLAAAEPEPPATMLVLDSSGSMWQAAPGGDRRSEVASAVVAGFLGEAGNSASSRPAVGLVRFGYGIGWQDSDYTLEQKCADVEVLRRPAFLDQPGTDEIARDTGVGLPMLPDGSGWNPKGKTPLSRAIQTAAQAVQPGGGNLVVVTDFDEEVCQPEPCPTTGPTLPAKLPRNVAVRFVIAAALKPVNEGKAHQLADCMRAEFLNPQDLDDARRVGRRVAQALASPDGPTPPSPAPIQPRPPRPEPSGSGRVAVQFEPGTLLPKGFTMAELGLSAQFDNNFYGLVGPLPIGSDLLSIGKPPGRYGFRVFGPRRLGLPQTRPSEISIGRAVDPPTLVNIVPAELTLSVRNRDGSPILDQIGWSVADERGRTSFLTPERGDRTVRLPPGRYEVRPDADGAAPPSKVVELIFGKRATVKFTSSSAAEPPRGTLSFVVRDAAGHQIAPDLPFRVEPIAGGEADPSPNKSGLRSLMPGHYRVIPPAAGTDFVLPANLPPLEATVAPDEPVEISIILASPS